MNRVSIYPNPANDFIQVKFPENMAHINVSITNSTGQVLFNLHFQALKK